MTGTGRRDDLYELLGVPRDAPAAEITRAYHRRARAVHPDARPGQAEEAARFRELEQAYRVLHDPARRAAYDQAWRPPAVQPAPAPPHPPAAARPRRPAARPPGAMLWAGPVRITPPAASPAAAQPAGPWLVVLAAQSSGGPEWGWLW